MFRRGGIQLRPTCTSRCDDAMEADRGRRRSSGQTVVLYHHGSASEALHSDHQGVFTNAVRLSRRIRETHQHLRSKEWSYSIPIRAPAFACAPVRADRVPSNRMGLSHDQLAVPLPSPTFLFRGQISWAKAYVKILRSMKRTSLCRKITKRCLGSVFCYSLRKAWFWPRQAEAFCTVSGFAGPWLRTLPSR